MSGPFAVGFDRAAVELDESPHEREPDAEPALRTFERPIDLREHFEHLAEHVGGDADAIVADANRDSLVGLGGGFVDGERDAAAGGRVLGGVVEHVEQHLRKPRGIGVDPDRLVRHVDRKFVPMVGDDRLARLAGGGDHVLELDVLRAQLDLAAADP